MSLTKYMNYDKLHRRIEGMLEYETDDYFLNIRLDPQISAKLLNYQYVHVLTLITALRSNRIILDGSDTGTGKTYSAIALCKQLNLRPLIICPKTILNVWKEVCEYFGTKPLAIVNYETFKKGKQYNGDNQTREISKYITPTTTNNIYTYTWNIPRDGIVIFDEAHKCKNRSTDNAKLLLSAKQHNIKCLLLSATIADNPQSFQIFGYAIGLYKTLKQANSWIRSMLREDMKSLSLKTSSIAKQIYPQKGSRMSINDLGDKFVKNQVRAMCYNISTKHLQLINESFQNIESTQLKLKDTLPTSTSSDILIKQLLKDRMRIEQLKIPILQDLISNYLENGFSVAVFVNFTDTLHALATKFKTDCILSGEQDNTTKMANITKFQQNKSRLILCTLQTACLGVSLHDKIGTFPRASIISPSFSSLDLKQVLGRIWRAGVKSATIQRIVYCAGTCEELICKNLTEKLKFMDRLNDDDDDAE